MKRSELLFTAIKPPLDYLALIFAAFVAYFIRYLPYIQNIRPVAFDLPFNRYFSLAMIIAVFWLIIFALSGLYHFRSSRKLREEFGRIFVACSAGLALILAVMVFSRYLFDSRFIILTAWGLAILFVTIDRLIIRTAKKIAYKVGFGVHRIVIIGNGQVAKQLTEEFLAHPGFGYRVINVFDEFNEITIKSLTDLVEKDGVDEIIKINPNVNPEQTLGLIDFANENHLDFRYTADFLGTQLTNLEVTAYAGMPVI